MSDGESRAPFYDNRWFKGIAAVVALLVSLAALSVPLRGVVDNLFSSNPPRVEWEIVFDRGENMNQTINAEGETKLTKAKKDLRGFVNPITSDGLALRTFDGKCNQTQHPLDVGFGANHNDDVINSINTLTSGEGQSNLFAAVAAAVQDFNDLPSDTVKKVAVYVGAINSCGGTTGGAEEATHIKQILEGRGINASFEFFTFNLSSEDQTQLDSFASVLPDVQLVPVGTSGPNGAE